MKSYIYACLFLSIVFNAVNCSQELNGTNATTNIAVPIVQLPYPVFPQLDQKQLDLEKKIALIRDGLKEIARARIAVTHTFTNDMENANTLYEEKLSKVRKEFSGIKHKMDKARSTEKIQKTIQSIKDIKTQIEGSKAKLKLTVENVKNVTAQSSKGKKLCQDLAVTAPYDNQYPHAILNQEKNLIQSMRAYLTKLHYGKHTHDALKNEAGDRSY